MPAKKKANAAPEVEVGATGAPVLSPPSTRGRARAKGRSATVEDDQPHILEVTSPEQPPPKKKGKKAASNNNDNIVSASAFVTMQRNTDRNANRIQAVETGLKSVNSSMKGLDQKFDKKLDAMMNLLQTSLSQRSEPGGRPVQSPERDPPVPTPWVSDDRRPPTTPRCSGLPPPSQLRAEENLDGELDRMLSREDYRINPATGKSQLCSEGQIVKPYMYVEREGIETIRQKLDIRQTLTPLEYISASLKLLHDTTACRPADRDHILRHVLSVSVDALTRPWGGVRKWTQSIWDSVEKGWCKWDDARFIQDERVRISYTGGAPPASQGGQHRPAAGSSIPSFPCKDFNGLSGCRHASSHEDNGIRYTHSCAYCEAMGKRSNHSIQRCRAKHEGYYQHHNMHGRSGHEGPSWYNNSGRSQGNRQYSGGHNRQGHSHTGSASKND